MDIIHRRSEVEEIFRSGVHFNANYSRDASQRIARTAAGYCLVNAIAVLATICGAQVKVIAIHCITRVARYSIVNAITPRAAIRSAYIIIITQRGDNTTGKRVAGIRSAVVTIITHDAYVSAAGR